MELASALQDFIFTGTPSILAATTGAEGASSFLDSQVGGTVTAILGALGVIVGIVGLLKAIGSFVSGKVGEGFKTIIMTTILAALMFNVQFTLDLASWLGGIVGQFIGSLSDIT